MVLNSILYFRLKAINKEYASCCWSVRLSPISMAFAYLETSEGRDLKVRGMERGVERQHNRGQRTGGEKGQEGIWL